MTKRERAIAIIEECRLIHLQWARWQDKVSRSGVDWRKEASAGHLGGPAHHRKWARNYDEVLEVLRR